MHRPGDRKRSRNTTIRFSRSAIISGRATRRSGVYCCSPLSENTSQIWPGIDGVRIWHDQTLIKEPYSNPAAFHLDVPYWSFTSADAITIWLAPDDATVENGCLYYVPGSHLARTFDNVGITSRFGSLFEIYPEWADVAPVPCPVPAGGALFHNGLTFHGAGATMTRGADGP